MNILSLIYLHYFRRRYLEIFGALLRGIQRKNSTSEFLEPILLKLETDLANVKDEKDEKQTKVKYPKALEILDRVNPK